ncbi:MAG: hypothetical protein JRH16_05420 [Deltaproteobacteria bacterium]|nr:hypothetical protein [Deltaproteobacteria bacterium]
MPAREDGAPAAMTARSLLVLYGKCVVAATLFWSPLLLGGGLQGHDWNTHHFHYFDWTRQAFSQYGAFPLFMADAWVTPNFLANAEAPSLGPLVWLLFFLPTGAYVKLLVVATSAFGLAGGWLLARELDAAPPVAALVAAAYAFGGFFASHLAVGHHWAMGAWLLPALVWLARRAVMGSDAALFAAAGLNAFTILGGQHQPFIWQNLLLGALALLWAVRVRATYPLLRLAGLVALAAALGAVKLVPLWLEFAGYAPIARIQGLPLASLFAALLSRGQMPGRVDPAIAYEFGAGWWEYAFYLGPVALVCLLAGLALARRVWPLMVIGAFFLLLAIEPGPWPLIEDLPVWRSQRCPSRFLVLALFAFWFAAASGLERLRRLGAARWPRGAAALCWALALLVVGDLWVEARSWQVAATGLGVAARTHRPVPEVLETPSGAAARLAEFAPNRLVYAVEAPAPARVVLPLRYGSGPAEWQVEGAEIEAADEWLALRVPAGSGEAVLRYRPPGLALGAGVSAAAWLACLGLAGQRRRAAT